MREGDSWDNITPELLEDCAQLTKANSIDGVFIFQSFIFFFIAENCGLGNDVEYLLIVVYCLGNKKDNVTVIYTPWSNLKKDGSMAVGQVGFHNQKMVCLFSLSSVFSILDSHCSFLHT